MVIAGDVHRHRMQSFWVARLAAREQSRKNSHRNEIKVAEQQ